MRSIPLDIRSLNDETIHWADVIAENALARGKKHTVASGITPSGAIHIGNMREVVTADAVFRALKDRGEDVRLIYIADTLDPLRKVYPFLSKDYENHVGKPFLIFHVPAAAIRVTQSISCYHLSKHFTCLALT